MFNTFERERDREIQSMTREGVEKEGDTESKAGFRPKLSVQLDLGLNL